jgi:hypothetical protein
MRKERSQIERKEHQNSCISPISAIVSAIDSGLSEHEARLLDAQEAIVCGDKYMLPF